MTSPAAARSLSRVVLGLTGGIAAYKAAELTRLLVKEGIAVDVVMTSAATQFIAPMTLQALSGNPVLSGLWDSGAANAMGHIELSRHADAIVVAPASADFIAKLANGHADDLLSTLCLARDCPLLIAPAMNRQMWSNAATQRNVAQLKADGVEILGPGSGDQACGEIGDGRMLEPEEILAALLASSQPQLLAGKRVLLTAGPTVEAIDPVRAITNHEFRQDGIFAGAGLRRSRRRGDAGVRTDGAVHADGRDAHRRQKRGRDGDGGRRPSRGRANLHRGCRGRRLHAGRGPDPASSRRTGSR